MQPNEYQEAAMRTKCSQDEALTRLFNYHGVASKVKGGILSHACSTQILHTVLRTAGEAGELASAVEKWIFYGRELDYTNLIEEAGDILWGVAELCDALGVSMEYVMKANIAKLRKRYPERFTSELAAEENRDREAEARAIEQIQKHGIGKIVGDSSDLPPTTLDYPTRCKVCKIQPVSKLNTKGVCPNCYSTVNTIEVEDAQG